MLFVRRLRDSHDLWHVATGYGRDGLGEVCLLAFTNAQTRNFGLGLIAIAGAIKFSREAKTRVPVFAALREARRMGKEAAWLPASDMEALLPRRLDEVRSVLKLRPPSIYRAVPAEVKDAFGKPEEAGFGPGDAPAGASS